MSLVGSLEDLGLGDVLQILALSRKTGLLHLRSEAGEGTLVFRDGRLMGALLKDGPADLHELVRRSGVITGDELDSVAAEASERGITLESALGERTALSEDRLEVLRAAAVEAAVLAVFSWRTGEFCFEMREDEGLQASGLLLRMGLSAEYLAMEGARLADEAASSSPPPAFSSEAASDDDDDVMFSGEDAHEESERAAAPTPTVDDVVEAVVEHVDDPGETPLADAVGAAPATTGQDAGAPTVGMLPPVIVIEPDLAALEWAKTSLAAVFPRVHAFQRPELGVGRLRQYLARGERVAVLVSDRVPPDPLSGARNAGEILERVKAQSPRALTALLGDAGSSLGGGRIDVRLARPPADDFVNPRRAASLSDAGRSLASALERALAAR
jgi:hypothetical protein